MPKNRRRGLPPALFQHLIDRVEDREISVDQLAAMSDWLLLERDVPYGKWFKRFSGLIVCGEGETIRTFLRAGQVPFGEEVF